MSRIFLTMFIASLINTSVSAKILIHINQVKNNEVNQLQVFDGRTINIKNDVKEIHTYNSYIDYIELNSNEILDYTDLIPSGPKKETIKDIRLMGIDAGG